MNILTVRGGVNEITPSFKELFQKMSEKGVILKEVTDTRITGIDANGATFEMEVYILSNDQISEKFKKEIFDYRVELRGSMALLKKQGLVTKETLNNIGQQFEFLGDKPAARKTTSKAATKASSEEVPVESKDKE